MGTFAYRQKVHLNRFDIKVVQASLDALTLKGEAWHISGSETPVAVLNAVRGDKNSRARMRKLAEKHGATLLEDVKAIQALVGVDAPESVEAEVEEATATKAPVATDIKGYHLQAFLPSWGLVDGKERWYTVGTTPQQDRIKQIQAAWTEAGYICRVKELRPRIHKVKDTLWDQPSEPIVSRIPGDAWVGDHLGPHLRAMGMTMAQYRDTFNYTGPAMVNRAAKSLRKAHDRIRRSNAIKLGMFVAEVKGDREVNVWRVEDMNDDQVTLVAITTKEDDLTIPRATLVTKYQMIEPWPNATKDKETGR